MKRLLVVALFLASTFQFHAFADAPKGATQGEQQKADALIDKWVKPADADFAVADVALQQLPWRDFLYLDAETERKDLPENARKWLDSFIEREQPRYAARVRRQVRRDAYNAWFEKKAIEKYDAIGRHNPKWDGLVKSAVHCWCINPPDTKSTYELLKKAVELGCDDPYVNYMYARQLETYGDREDTCNRLQAAALAMARSKYSVSQKEAAALRAYEVYYAFWKDKTTKGSAKLPPGYDKKAQAMVDSLFGQFDQMTMEKGVSETMIEDIATRIIDLAANGSIRKAWWDYIKPPLEKSLAKSPVIYILKGRFNIKYAWDARGGGWANTVTPEGWKLFAERLAIAHKMLDKAWEMDPTRSETAKEMLTIALGENWPRAQMEVWFDRAMELDPDNYDACWAKLYYLEPKWHGSPQEMLEFGHQCLEAGNWASDIPFTLLDAHRELAAYEGDSDTYWSAPKVWDDVEVLYVPYLKATGLNPGARSRHCFYACKGGHWNVARDEFKTLGDKVVASEFGGKEAMEKFRKSAQEKASEN